MVSFKAKFFVFCFKCKELFFIQRPFPFNLLLIVNMYFFYEIKVMA